MVALVGLPLLLVVVQDLVNAKNASQLFLWLFSYDYVHSPRGRPWPDQLDFSTPLIVFGLLFALATIGLAFRRLVRPAIVGLGGGGGAVHLVLARRLHGQGGAVLVAEGRDRRLLQAPALARREADRLPDVLARRDLLHEERDLRRSRGGPHRLRQEGADEKLGTWIGRHRGRRIYFIFERGRQGRLQGLLPAENRASFTIIYETNNKFSVAYADI